MQDRANVSADFLDLMKQEIIEVIKKYIDVDENAIDVRLTNKANGDGTTGAPALYANIPIVSIKEEVKSKMARQNGTNESEQSKQPVSKEKTVEQNEKQEVKEKAKPEENKEEANLEEKNKVEEKEVAKEQVTAKKEDKTEEVRADCKSEECESKE